jgi:hypothetical protein
MDLRLFQNAQARGSRAAKGSSASVRWHTIQPEAEGAASDDPPKKKKKIQHDVFTQRQTGGVSSRTSFVNANASPMKSQRHKQTVDWIETPCDNPDKQELCWVDPDFQDYIEDISINPRKRKRTAGVRVYFTSPACCVTIYFPRMTLFDCLYPKSPHFLTSSSDWKAAETLHMPYVHSAPSMNRRFGVWTVLAATYSAPIVLFHVIDTTLCTAYR